jgi:hypothetical protein
MVGRLVDFEAATSDAAQPLAAAIEGFMLAF